MKLLDVLLEGGKARTLRQLDRFVKVGVTLFVIQFILFVIFTWLGMGPVVATAILYIAQAWAKFFIHRDYTFRHGNASCFYKESYGLLQMSMFPLKLWGVGWLVSVGVWQWLSYVVTAGFLAGISFAAGKLIFFRKNGKRPVDD